MTLIKEDYFDNLEIREEDINADDTSYSATQQESIEDLNARLVSRYSRCIVIASRVETFPDDDSQFWNHRLPKILKRLFRVLDAYNVDYDRQPLFRDVSRYGDPIAYEYRGHRILSSYKTRNQMLNHICLYKKIYIVVYVNFPSFSYRESYNFIDRMQNTIWKTKTDEDDIIEFEISSRLYSLYDFNNYDNNSFRLPKNRRNELIPAPNNTKYKKFFADALRCFCKDNDRIWRMRQKISDGKNPFS